MSKTKPLSRICVSHYVKLVLRSSLLIAVLINYIVNKDDMLKFAAPIPLIAWLFLMVDMVLRLFPSKLESMGCQKQFKKNYEPIDVNAKPVNQSWKRTAVVVLVWLALNAAIGALYFLGVIDKGILFLIALAYSVCDIICIMFFCPFQTWFMKNRCCTTCRIYNWDFPMMCTPLVFIPSIYTYTLLGFSLIILVRWELTLRVHSERFSTATNKCMDCSRCEEKLCQHKRQLRNFIKKNKSRFY